MLTMIQDRDDLWKRIKKDLPEIKDILETAVLQLKLANNPNAFLKINFGYSSNKEPLIRCHIYKSLGYKIFSLYYNTILKKMFIRNKLNFSGKLSTSSDRINITSIEDLKNLLKQLVIKI